MNEPEGLNEVVFTMEREFEDPQESEVLKRIGQLREGGQRNHNEMMNGLLAPGLKLLLIGLATFLATLVKS